MLERSYWFYRYKRKYMSKFLLITGGRCGIGAAVAEEAVRHGYAVCINYNRNQQKVNLLCNKLLAMGGKPLQCKRILLKSKRFFHSLPIAKQN